MAENKVKPISSAQAADETKRLKKIKGDNFETMNVLVDPTSYATIKVRQGMVDYYDIVKTVDQNAARYEPKPKTEGQVASGRVATEGAAQRSGVARGKLIRIPVNPEKPPADKVGAMKGKLGKQTAVLVDRKFYFLRVPYCMSINAIAIMINTQFKTNAPPYIITPAGKKWYINTEYKDKNKLPKIGKSKGGKAADVPEDKGNVDANVQQG